MKKNNLVNPNIRCTFTELTSKPKNKMEYTFTKDQLETFVEFTQGLSDYQGTHDSPQEYDDWLEEQFGEDRWDMEDLYQYEFDVDWWYGYTIGKFSQEILDWVENTKHDFELTRQDEEEE